MAEDDDVGYRIALFADLQVLQESLATCHKKQVIKLWVSEIGGCLVKILEHSTSECESKRIIYVALSRPAQYLRIMTPQGKDDSWRDLSSRSVSA